MKISGLTVSVNYSEMLAQSIPVWRETLDELIVVTSTRDSQTMALCSCSRTKFVATDVFFANGAMFNKSAAMDVGYARLNPDDWVLCFDADVIPDLGWREKLPDLEIGNIYGAARHLENGHRIPDENIAGFFNLFHSTDPNASGFGSWISAAAYDAEFVSRWHPLNRKYLPLDLLHLGQPGQNWCGVNRSDLMLKMYQERARFGGHEHERLA